MATKYNMIHKIRTTLLPFKSATCFLFQCAPQVTRYYYVTLVMIIIFLAVCKW